jgi:lantibiotic biosynthesis protein
MSQACRVGIGMPRTRQLLDDTVCWLLAHQNDDTVNSAFDSVISANEEVPLTRRRGCRLAWCYGDLGLSTALLGAALAVGNAGWARHALSIARRAAGRSFADSGVRDAGLCHGAAGNAHMFNRLYQATGDRVFLDAARVWLRRTLQFYRPDHGFGGYRAWTKPPESPEGAWVHVPGLLMGTAGIGLALISALTPVEPLWDQVLLVTLPTGRTPFGFGGTS